jgi:hypothetical protein
VALLLVWPPLAAPPDPELPAEPLALEDWLDSWSELPPLPE